MFILQSVRLVTIENDHVLDLRAALSSYRLDIARPPAVTRTLPELEQLAPASLFDVPLAMLPIELRPSAEAVQSPRPPWRLRPMAGFRLQPVVKLLPWQREESEVARPGPTRFPFWTEKPLEFSALLDGFRLDPQNRVLYLCRFEFHRGPDLRRISRGAGADQPRDRNSQHVKKVYNSALFP